MTDSDLAVICSVIDEQKDYLNSISQEIWKNPELLFEEKQAHLLLTSALKHFGFEVFENYVMPTAFRAEFTSSAGIGTRVAIFLEYDALPEIGHACGHNLIAEAGLAAAIGIKAAMTKDPTLAGKVVVLGSPAEEGGGGKIELIEANALNDVDVALIVHPFYKTDLIPLCLCSLDGSVCFQGKEAHAAAIPWNGINALDAAVTCYQNIAQLRQHMKPTSRINAIITKGGSAVNVIPAETEMHFLIRTTTLGDLNILKTRIEDCIKSAAKASGCSFSSSFHQKYVYENLLTNKVLISTFTRYLKLLGFSDFGDPSNQSPVGSTDMGNVSHVIPSIHPLYAIPTDSVNHSPGFTESAGAPTAQESTLIMGKAMALTALHVMRSQDVLRHVRKQFELDVKEDLLS